MQKIVFTLVVALGLSHLSHAVDHEQIKKDLAGAGLKAEIHGIYADQNIFVLTVRNPQNFFDFESFSMIPANGQVLASFRQLKRHDQVLVHGSFGDNPSKQGHIEITALDVTKPFENPYNPRSYEYEAKIPDDLLKQSSAEFLVHAVNQKGEVLVVEYKDAIVPVFVKPEQAIFTKDLYRNDLIKIDYTIAKFPESPTHLKLNPLSKVPVQVVDAMLPRQGKAADVTGPLVLFPKSPVISTNVYAILEKLPSGVTRQYTLINFDNVDLFKQIQKKCEDAWNKDPKNFVNGRNKLVHNVIQVRANGKFNVVGTEQANVQILIDKIDDLEIIGH